MAESGGALIGGRYELLELIGRGGTVLGAGRTGAAGPAGGPVPAVVLPLPGTGPGSRLGPGPALPARGLVCTALAWAVATVFPAQYIDTGPLGIALFAPGAGPVNTAERPKPSAGRSWFLFLTVNTALFMVGVFLPYGWGWDGVLHNVPLLAPSSWALWWLLPGARQR